VSLHQAGPVVEVVVASPFLAEALERQYADAIREAARDGAAPHEPRVEFRLGGVAAQDGSTGGSAEGGAPAEPGRAGEESPAAPARAPSAAAEGRRAGAKRTVERFLLEDFVVGPSNALAYECAARIGDASGPAPFHVLFLHGECGVGKTHLLSGVAARFVSGRPEARVRCVTAEAFTNEYIASVRGNAVDAFRRRHRDLELLCVDDIHFLSKKESTQAEFLHTFDALELRGTRICLASDEHPARIRSFSKELVSRFLSGMVVEVERPDRATGTKIAQRLALRRGIALDEASAGQLAGRCGGSVRDIEGAVVRLDALRRLPGVSDGRVTAALLERALGRAGVERPRRPLRVDRIVEHVSEALGGEVAEVLGRGRQKRVVLARSLVAHLAKRLTTMSYPEIARAMSRPNHSSVITACQRVEAQMRGGALCGCGPGLDHLTVEELAQRLERELVRTAEAA